jgi:hypothetical protein
LTSFLGLDLANAAPLYLGTAMLGSLALAVALHLLFERPVRAALRHAFMGRRDVRA